MAPIEQIEMNAHRAQLDKDVRALVEKYRSIFDWDVPEIDEAASDRLLLPFLVCLRPCPLSLSLLGPPPTPALAPSRVSEGGWGRGVGG